MNSLFTVFLLFFFSSGLFATEYVKIWVNGQEDSVATQGDFLAWEYDVSVLGGSGQFKLILDLDENGVFDESDVLLVEFIQTDGEEGNDGPGDNSSIPDGIVHTEMGPFGFAPAHYILMVTDTSDQSEASVTLEILPLANPAATINGNISKVDVAPPNEKLANIMIISQLEEGFAGYWTGITNDQGNFTINLPDTAVGTIWNIELLNDDYDNYIVDDHYEDVSIHAGANSGFNFHFDLPSSYVYGRLIDDQGIDVILNDHAMLTNTNSNGHFDSEIIDGHFLIPIAFEPGKNSGQFRLYIWGEFLPPNYMVPQFWNNDDYTFTINEGDSIEKNIILQRTDEEIYVQILLDGEAPEMAFEVQAYDEQGQTYTITSNEGWGTLAVKGTGYYNLFVTFDDEDLDPLPAGYTFKGGSSTSAAAGDTARIYIVGSTSAISGKLSFADGDSQVEYDAEEFRIRIEESEWSEPQGIYLNDSLNYHFDLLDGTYRMWFETHRDDFLAMPTFYEDLELTSDSLENIDFELNYRHANIFVKVKNAPFDATNYYWNIFTDGEPPNIYETWTSGDQDSTFHFSVCDGEWWIEPPNADTSSIKLTVTNEGTDYYVEFDYNSREFVTGLNDKPKQLVHKYKLVQNYPNPFNPTTKIDYELAHNSHVKLIVYDILGREIKTLVNDYQNAGNYSIGFDASRLASGIYFYKLATSKGYIKIRKMILSK